MKKIIIVVALVMAIGTTAQAGLNYGVIFSGGVNAYNNHDRYYDQTLRMWEIMTGTLGYDEVYVLFADGLDPGIDSRSGVSSDWSMIPSGHIEAATYSNLESRLISLQSLIGPDDCFHFWGYDHGYKNEDIYSTTPATQDLGGLCAWDEGRISDNVFASWVNPIDAYAESYIFGNCFSGDMFNELNILPGENRFAAWSTGWWQTSHSQSDAGFLYEWANAIEVEGLRSTYEIYEFALLNDYYGPYGTEEDTPGMFGANFHIITNQPIPAPGAILLGSIGVGLVSWLRRRRAL